MDLSENVKNLTVIQGPILPMPNHTIFVKMTHNFFTLKLPIVKKNYFDNYGNGKIGPRFVSVNGSKILKPRLVIIRIVLKTRPVWTGFKIAVRRKF